MADWNLPTLTSLYTDFLTYLKGRDDDSITLGKNIITNPIVGTVRYERTTNTFQEWSGTAWINLVISMASGGVGATTPGAVRIALGIGTMGVQDANNVNITGGNISNLGSLAVNGNTTIGGTLGVGGVIQSNQYVYGVTGLYAGNPAVLITVPSGRLDSTKISGIVPAANLGSGTPTNQTYLRGDGTWALAAMYRANLAIKTTVTVNALGAYDVPLTGFTNVAKMFFIPTSLMEFISGAEIYRGYYSFPDANTLRFTVYAHNGSNKFHPIAGMVLEIM